MVGILLLILKIIGWIILILITILLVILSIVLFVPIRYQVNGSNIGDVILDVKVRWLLKIVKFDFEYQKSTKYRLKVLWKTLNSSGYEQKEMAKQKQKVKRKQKNRAKSAMHNKTSPKKQVKVTGNTQAARKQEIKKTVIIQEEPTKEQKNRSDDTILQKVVVKQKEPTKEKLKSKPATQQEIQGESKGKNNSNIKNGSKPKEEPKEKSKGKLDVVMDKFHRVQDFIKDKSYKGVIKFVLKHVWKVIKSILPKKTKIYLEFGFEDPALTGLSLGAMSIFYAILGNSMVIKPDFENKVMKGQFRFKGRIIIFIIVYHAVKIILDKRVKKLIAEYKK